MRAKPSPRSNHCSKIWIVRFEYRKLIRTSIQQAGVRSQKFAAVVDVECAIDVESRRPNFKIERDNTPNYSSRGPNCGVEM